MCFFNCLLHFQLCFPDIFSAANYVVFNPVQRDPLLLHDFVDAFVECVDGVHALGHMRNLSSSHLYIVLSTNHFKLIVRTGELLPRRLFVRIKPQSVLVFVTAVFQKRFLLPMQR